MISLNNGYYDSIGFSQKQDSLYEIKLKKDVDYNFALVPRKFQTHKQFTNLSLIIVDKDTLYFSNGETSYSSLWFDSFNTYNSKITKDCAFITKT